EALGLQKKRGERWQGQCQAEWPSMHRVFFRPHPAHVPHSASAIFSGIAVEQLPPVAPARDPDAVPGARYGSEVEHAQDGVFLSSSLAQERDGAGSAVIAIDPLKTL